MSTDGTPRGLNLPTALAGPLGTDQATCVPLGDGKRLLGVLVVDGSGHPQLRLSLLSGIARQLSLRIENTLLMEEAAIRKSLENELAVARSIQESFLPKVTPAYHGWQVETIWRVARSVGGDFYDFIPLSPGPDGPRLGVVIADVADKGVPAALFMALCRTLLRSVAIKRVDPGLTLKRMNDFIFADTQTDLFVSVFYAVWEPNTSRLTYANGGHNPPILFARGAQPRLLAEHGMVLGVSEGQSYQTHTVTLPRNSTLLLYTDGLTEAAAPDGSFYGVPRLMRLVQGLDDWSADKVAAEITRGVFEFVGDPDPTDDMTAVILSRRA
jgi:sigma-B regulation protein RsbU (phosphoserine phosphatase)